MTSAADLTVYQLRRGAANDQHAFRLGLYQQLADATEHGLNEYHDHIGHADRLSWYPEDDAETVHRLYATVDGVESETEWHVVAIVAAASYDPDAEG